MPPSRIRRRWVRRQVYRVLTSFVPLVYLSLEAFDASVDRVFEIGGLVLAEAPSEHLLEDGRVHDRVWLLHEEEGEAFGLVGVEVADETFYLDLPHYQPHSIRQHHQHF